MYRRDTLNRESEREREQRAITAECSVRVTALGPVAGADAVLTTLPQIDLGVFFLVILSIFFLCSTSVLSFS